MALNIIHNFNLVNAINDSFSCQLSTNAYVLSPRSRAGANITIFSTSPVANTLQMNVFDALGDFEEFSIFIRFTPTPSEVYDIPIAPHSTAPNTLVDIQEAIIDALNAQPAFSLFFTFEKNGADKVLIQSKSDEINLFTNTQDPFNGNVLFTNLTSVSSPPLFRDDYKLLVQIAEKQGAFFANIAEQEIIPNYLDIVFFQNLAFAEINIHQHFQNSFSLNRFDFNSASLWILADDVMKHVQVTVIEVYNGAFQEGKKFDNLIAFNAGSTHSNRQGRNSFASKIASGTFLHNNLLNEVRRNQKHFVCFSVPSDTSFVIKVQYELGSGGGFQEFTKFSISADNNFRNFLISGYLEALFPGSLHNILDDVLWFNISILDSNNDDIFESIWFEVNHSISDYKQFIFKNYFGVWEGVYADTFSLEDEVSHEMATKPFSMFNNFGNGSSLNINKKLTQKAKASFGYKYFSANNHLLEFLESDEVYVIIDDQWIPIIFDKNKNEIKNSLENITPFVFDYQYAVDKKVKHV